MRVTLEESLHIYRNESGEEVPALTKLIAAVFQTGTFHHDEDASQRGTAAHHGCRLMSTRGLKPTTFHSVVQPYCIGWETFTQEMDYRPEWFEVSIGSRLGFACTPDTLGDMGGALSLIEIKTGSVPLTVGIQLAGQEMAIRENFPKTPPFKRRVVHLPGDGRHKLLTGITHPKHGRLEFDNPIWDQWWISCLNVAGSGFFKLAA